MTPEVRISSHIAPEGSGSSSLLSVPPLALQKAVLGVRFTGSVNSLLDRASTVSLPLTGTGNSYKPGKTAQSPTLVNHLKSAQPQLKG